MKKLILSLLFVAGWLVQSAAAQDPLKVAPQAYQREFENEWVMVTRVHYGPREKIPEHFHTERSSAYVYLNDGGPIIFKHIDLPYANVTRQATKAGSFRVYHGLKEVHAVENPTETPSDFLRVEFKTEVVNAGSLRGKFFREEVPAGENLSKVQFENEQVRITRLVIAPRGKLEVATDANMPALFVALAPAQVQARSAKGKAAKLTLALGKTHWLNVSQAQQWTNTSDGATELLRFDFKTKPVAVTAAAHEHKHND
ncbi:MAG: hypothetical protein HOP19_09810 [Acidobacteria bacterium]|nr:hypothetical protein [Acidobacteriota bacterium]